MRRYVRVRCQDTADEWSPLFIDIVIDENGQLAYEAPVCGWWGAARSEEVEPFVAWPTENGGYRLDFGMSYDADGGAPRYRSIELPTELTVGAPVAFRDHANEELVNLVVADATDICTRSSIF